MTVGGGGMSAMDHPTLLQQLIITGELTIQMRSTRTPEALAELITSIETEYARPADGERVIDLDTIIFGTALIGAAAALGGHDRNGAAKYLRVVGVLMPEIRSAYAKAIEARRRPTP
jgi:NAD(P)H-dependent flavin oxidoreductase YrpB (nitropropane dioxygenase family)